MKNHFLRKTINGKKLFLDWLDNPVEDIREARKYNRFEALQKSVDLDNTEVVERQDSDKGVIYKSV